MNHDWEFMEMILRELPSNIFFKDTECRYLFATHYWRHIKHDEEEEWSIKGKTDLEIRKDKENAQLAYEQDKKILATGKGCQYTIEINLEGKTEYLEIIKNPVRDKEGKIIGIVGLINDVTDRMKLHKQLEVYAQTDIMTGLYNRRYLEYWRKSVLRPDMFPLSIISADCDGLKYMNDVYGHAVGDELIRTTSILFKISSLENAVMFRVGGDEFLIILLKTPEKKAKESISRMKSIGESLSVQGMPLSISFGTYTLETFGDDFEEAVKIADKNMYAEKESKRRCRS